MAIPAAVLTAAKYAPALISALGSLFGGDSPQEKARKRLQKLAEMGLDPKVLNRALAIQAAREQQEQSGILARSRSGGLDPSSGIVQELLGASKRGLASRQGEARALFDEESERAKQRANEILAGQPEDNTFAQLATSATSLLDELSKRPGASTAAAAGQAGAAAAQLPAPPSASRGNAALPGIQQTPLYEAPQQRQTNYDFLNQYFPNLRGGRARVSPLIASRYKRPYGYSY